MDYKLIQNLDISKIKRNFEDAIPDRRKELQEDLQEDILELLNDFLQQDEVREAITETRSLLDVQVSVVLRPLGQGDKKGQSEGPTAVG